MLRFDFSAEQCLAFIERSPEAVAAHDWPAWRALFAAYSLVEDPVGARPCVQRPGDDPDTGPLARFYQTFIAANAVRFDVHRDIVCGHRVWRDLDIHITLASGAEVVTPTHLLYELTTQGDELRIFRLAAHWELAATARQQSGGAGALWRMLRILGPTGVAGYLRALASVGEKGKARVTAMERRMAAGQPVHDLFAAADTRLQLVAQCIDLDATQCRERISQLRLAKLVAAGSYVCARIEFAIDGARQSGFALFRLHPQTLAVESLEIFSEPCSETA